MTQKSNGSKFQNHYSRPKVYKSTFQKLNSNLTGKACLTFKDSQTHLQLCICYYQNNDIPKSIKHLKLAVKHDKDNFVALYWLALIQYKKLKDFKNAVRTFQKVLSYRHRDKFIKYYYTGNPDAKFDKSINYIIYMTFNKLLIN